MSNSLFDGWGLWPDVTTPATGNPKFIRKSFHVQGVDSTKTFASGYAVTTNLGSTWSQYATFPESRRDLPKLSDPGAQPVLYQSIRAGWDPVLGLEVDDLARVVKRLFGAGADVSYPMMNRFGSLGINPTTFAWYQVFGVDPANTKHVIAPDIVNEKTMETKDGAENWNEMPNLTSKVTNSGQFLFRRGIFPQASAVSFSPEDPNLVAIGTSQAGLFISGNRGATWSKVPGSDPVTYITSIEWRTANEAFVSTYGRGLWRLRWGLIRALPDFERLCKFVCTIRPLSPPTEPVERFKQAVLVFNGRIQGARTTNGRLTELFISPGSSVSFFSDSTNDMNVKVTERRQVVGFSGAMMPPAPVPRRGMLVGLTLGERGNLLGAAFSGETLRMYEPTEEEKNQDRQPSGRQTSPTVGQPYLRVTPPRGSAANAVLPGAPLTISGRNFQRGAPLEIQLDDIAVATVRGGGRGEFSVGIKAPRDFGLHRVTVREATAQEVIDGAMFIVTHEDRRRDQR